MKEAFENIAQGLWGAIAYARGEGGATVHYVAVPEMDVKSIQVRTGLSQAVFAKSIGVEKTTLIDWELRRLDPEGPALVLLALIDKDPKIVQRSPAFRPTHEA